MYLNCKTYFSFRYGTWSTRELVEAAAALDIDTLALTNINSTCDLWDFVLHCREAGIKPVAGVEIRNGQELLYILLAANNRGLRWIHHFLSEHLQSGKPFPESAEQHPFLNGRDGFVIYPFSTKGRLLQWPNERMGIRASQLHLLALADMKTMGHRLVVLQPVTIQDSLRYNAHRLLRAIDANVLLSKLPPSHVCAADEVLVPPARLLELFRRYPVIVTNTYQLLEQCSIEMTFYADKNKRCFSATPDDDRILLEKLALDGLRRRYGNREDAASRVRHELQVIHDLGFNAYFLITWDIIRYAQGRGFYHVGRGSGANSIVAYCLEITDVDPIELNLYFERFLNPHRTSPPDFDIDFSWLDRDEVIDYIFKRYGRNQVALLGMYSTFQRRAVVRELGKVFGLPKEEIDRFAEDVSAAPPDRQHQQILRYGKLLENFPNHLSIHPGGVLISELDIHEYATLFMPPKGFATAQLDMFVAENIGLYKLDILSQRGLGHIRESLSLIQQNKGITVDIHAVEQFKQDPAVRARIRAADTIGCFYIESPAMRQLLKKLRCDDYLTLVAASSIIRPGVAQSGMMKAYIERFHHPEKIEYLHPIMKDLLEETFGVMVFQEDVIKVAHFFAGLDLGEADILRRAMSGKYRSSDRFRQIEQKFYENCAARGYPDALSHEVWRQMESFAGYSFNKAHSASFAVESFQSLFLKTHYPLEFMVAVINNFGGFYSRELYFLELEKAGGKLELPCINNSNYYTNIAGDRIYAGFIHLKSLPEDQVQFFLSERNTHGYYTGLLDFIERTGCSRETLNMLVQIGAFRFTGQARKRLLWEANFFQRKQARHGHQLQRLFKEAGRSFELPELSDHPLDIYYEQLELMGFILGNPFLLADDDPSKYVAALELPNFLGRDVTVMGYYIERKVVPTSKGGTMCFASFLDYKLNWLDTVFFPEAFRRFPLRGRGFYRICGKVLEEYGAFSIDVRAMEPIGYKSRNHTFSTDAAA